MKKFISILLTFMLLAATVVTPFAYSDTDGHTYQNDIDELTAMGLVEAVHETNFLPDMRMTRAAFCKLTVDTMQMQLNADKIYFPDVPVGHEAIDEISYAAEKGVMVGYKDGYFRPDQTITLGEALKVLVVFLGYQYKTVQYGTDMSSYVVIANELNLLKGLKLNANDELTRGAACRLVNNALDVPLPIPTGFGADTTYEISRDTTLLTRYLKMNRDEGIVESNSLISVQKQPLAGDDNIVIDDIVFRCQTPQQMDLVGYNVRYIYKLGEPGDVKELVYLRKEGNKELTIKRSDFVSFHEDNTIYYLNEKEEELKLKISEQADIFYNGQYVPFSDKLFSDIEVGQFHFISSDNDNIYDIVYLEEYDNYSIR